MVKSRKSSGFTLVELIIALAVLGIAIPVIFMFFSFAQSSFSRAERQSALLQDMNLAVSYISKDIRSASKPNGATNAVVVLEADGALAAGQSMNIYRYDSTGSKYIRICYRLQPADKTVLQRGLAECPGNPPDTANPLYGNITSWETVLNGVSDKRLFTDNSASAGDERRKILVDLSINNIKNPLPKPLDIIMTVTSRSEVSP